MPISVAARWARAASPSRSGTCTSWMSTKPQGMTGSTWVLVRTPARNTCTGSSRSAASSSARSRSGRRSSCGASCASLRRSSTLRFSVQSSSRPCLNLSPRRLSRHLNHRRSLLLPWMVLQREHRKMKRGRRWLHQLPLPRLCASHHRNVEEDCGQAVLPVEPPRLRHSQITTLALHSSCRMKAGRLDCQGCHSPSPLLNGRGPQSAAPFIRLLSDASSEWGSFASRGIRAYLACQRRSG
mmetsp:Transcript_119730/g.298649  ORF Transcript_119730/g.298649 Transcript_119730/m.298649 type:complete len:240 (+) Transcript_119730:466-1185(+)